MMIVFVLLFRLGLFQSALAGPSEDQAMQRGPIFTAVESAVDCYQIFKRFEEYVAEHAGPEGNITLYDTESIQKVSSNCWGQFNSMGFPKIAHINPTEILLDVTAFLYQQGYGPATGPAFTQWIEDCQGVIDKLESQYTTNYTFNSKKDYIWVMNEKCSALIYQSALNKSIPIPDVPMPTVISWAKDYIFGDCVHKNNSGAIWGVGENKTFPFNGLKTVILPSNVAVRTWWEIMGWPSHVERFLELPSWANDSETPLQIRSRSDPGSGPKPSKTFGHMNTCFDASNIFTIWSLPKPGDFQEQALVPKDCQQVISILRNKYTDPVTFEGVDTRIREDGGNCTALI
ncbi:hypothetical protein QBC36DRAFT_289331 [Triangularia setosa]|uniref:Uncharacterized protein n=1 Tax=Triangularia setosa TaxID=2587417 RepID=A0AAN6W9R5_9PEZI|nr:hypothetical protein QBC36DRAFT_289331 [Podospora setosa]